LSQNALGGPAPSEVARAAAPWGRDPLGFLIAPNCAADFLETVYEKTSLIVHRQEPQRYSSVLSIDMIDRMVAGMDLRAGQLDLANAQRPVRREDYVTDGLVDRGVVARQHQGGSTIILQQMHQFDPTLSDFCRALEQVFSCHIQTNIYLSPPEAQGFSTHYDSHDVFVVQVEGEKHWRLYDKPVDLPYRGERFDRRQHKAGALKEEFVLKAGDCAYVPRGMLHDASTSEGKPSLHITVGLIVKTWADLLIEAVSEAALHEPAARRALPPGYAQQGFDRDRVRPEFAVLAQRVMERVRLDPAMDVFQDGFIRSRAPDTRGAVARAATPVADADRFVARPFAAWRLVQKQDALALITAGGDISFVGAEKPGLERALSGVAFGLADLTAEGAPKPEEMIQRLVAFGLVTIDKA